MSIENNYTVFVGEAVTITASPAPSQQPTAISGWTLKFVLRASLMLNAPILLTKTTASGIIITDGPLGLFQISLLASDLLAIGPGMYRYDVYRVDPGFQTSLAWGRLNILPTASVLE